MTDATLAPAFGLGAVPPADPAAPALTPAELADLQRRVEAAELNARLAAAQKSLATATTPTGTGVAAAVVNAVVVAPVAGTGRLMACFWRSLTGLRTVLAFGITGALALATEFGNLDLTPLVAAFLPAGSKLNGAALVVLMSALGILLRLITNTPVFSRWRPAATGAKVDEPSAP